MNVFTTLFWLGLVDPRNGVVDPVADVGLCTRATGFVARNVQHEGAELVGFEVGNAFDGTAKVENERLKMKWKIENENGQL